MFELMKEWPPQYQFGAFAIVILAMVVVSLTLFSVACRALTTLRHGYPPQPDEYEDTPDPPLFKYSYTGPPEHAPSALLKAFATQPPSEE